MTPDFQRIFHAMPDGVFLVDEEGRLRDLNRTAAEMFGYDRDELVGTRVEQLVPEGHRDAHRSHRHAYEEDPYSRPMGVGMRLRGRRVDGSEFPVEIALQPLEEDGEVFVIASVRDQTERHRLEEFGQRTLQAVEEERQRIARDLHDDTAQHLSTLLLRIRMALDSDRTVGPSFLEDLRREIQEAADGVRRIASNLRPPALREAGLGSVLHTHARKTARSADLELETRIATDIDQLLPQKQLAAFRIAQEALSNAVRHADAERLTVTAEVRQDRAVLEIVDDGRGFEIAGPPTALAGRGLGLIGIYERARSVDGEAVIESEPGRGTTVRVTIPLAKEERAAS